MQKLRYRFEMKGRGRILPELLKPEFRMLFKPRAQDCYTRFRSVSPGKFRAETNKPHTKMWWCICYEKIDPIVSQSKKMPLLFWLATAKAYLCKNANNQFQHLDGFAIESHSVNVREEDNRILFTVVRWNRFQQKTAGSEKPSFLVRELAPWRTLAENSALKKVAIHLQFWLLQRR